MPTLTIKNVPDALYRRLKKRAAEHRCSLNSEIIACLERAIAAETVHVATTLALADRI